MSADVSPVNGPSPTGSSADDRSAGGSSTKGLPGAGPSSDHRWAGDVPPERRQGRGTGTRRRRRAAPEPPDLGAAALDREPDPESVARSIALRLLTAAPRSRAQLADALTRRDVPDDVATTVLDRFAEVGLIDDAQYARTLVRSRQADRGLARRALGVELRRKGIDDDLAAAALETVDPEQERVTARALARRRLAASRGLPDQVRIRRVVGMLGRKGYPGGLALQVVREALAEETSSGEGVAAECAGHAWDSDDRDEPLFADDA